MPAKAAEKPKPKSKADDPFNLHRRTEEVYDWLLTDWEKNKDLKNRSDAIKILQYGGNFLVRNLKLQETADVSNAGSSVRRYSGAFRTKAVDGTGGGKASTGRTIPALVHSVVSDDESDDPEAA